MFGSYKKRKSGGKAAMIRKMKTRLARKQKKAAQEAEYQRLKKALSKY